jgi:hypothetical protein
LLLLLLGRQSDDIAPDSDTTDADFDAVRFLEAERAADADIELFGCVQVDRYDCRKRVSCRTH